MDRDRFKRKEVAVPQKRSINGEEKPFTVQPTVIPQPHTVITPTKPLQKAQSQAAFTHTSTESVNSSKDSAKTEVPSLFDGDDDEDLFGVWATQKKLKKARQQKEQQEKAKKLAAKEAKKAAKLARKQAGKASATSGEPHEIAVKISVPRVSKIKAVIGKGYKPEYRRRYVIGGALVALPLCIIVAGLIANSTATKDTKTTDVLGQATQAAKPDFSTLRPTTMENQATDTKYDGEKKVASYNDVLKDITITVSQQPLPSDFKASPTSSVENLAKQINANEKISASDTTAFAGVSIKGPQTVVFTKNDLLFFITADKKIDVLTWSKYIEGLR